MRGPLIALPPGPAAKLIVDAATFVSLGPDDVQATHAFDRIPDVESMQQDRQKILL